MSTKVLKQCVVCKKEFSVYRSYAARGYYRACSRTCKARARTLETSAPASIAARFWPKVVKDGPLCQLVGTKCWQWTGKARDPDGRGVINLRQKPVRAPRVAWFLHHGAWPSSWILHKCDNPSCVNPAHLYEGTVVDNARDMMSRGRGRYFVRRGTEHPGAKLTEWGVRDIRRRAAAGESGAALARRFGMARSTMSEIIRGLRWPHLV